MLSCEEGEEVALRDGLLVLAWEFDVVLPRCRLVAGVSSVCFYQCADRFFAVCVG